MNTSAPHSHVEPVPEINEISSLLGEQYDAPHMTLYYEAGLSEPELGSDIWEYRELEGAAVDEALGAFLGFVRAALAEFETVPNQRLVARVRAYLETLPKIESALRDFVAPAQRVLRQVSELDDESVEGLTTLYFLVNGRWFYLSYGRIENLENPASNR